MKVLKKNGKFYAKYGALAKGTTPSWWNNCVLLTHFDGDDGATSAIDSSDSNHTLTFNSDVEIDTAIKKFGTGSLLCKPSNPTVTTDSHADFNFYNKSYTIDCQIYIPTFDWSTDNYQYGILKTSNPNGIGTIYCDSERFWISVNGVNVISLDNGGNGGAWKPSQGWHHFEFSRDHATNTYYLFLDGIMQQSSVNTAQVVDANQAMQIGYGYESYYWFTNAKGDGQLDEIRILNGICEHTENFTPPTQAYENLKPSTLPIKFNQGWTNEMYDKYIYEYTQNPNEVLKLHMDGTQGSTTFTDSSPVANTITRHGGAIIDTNNKKFGTGAGLFNGSSDYLQLSYNSHFDFSTSDWTVDSWFNMSSIGGTIISKDKYGSNFDFSIAIDNSTQISSYSHGANENFTVAVPEMSVNVWYHVALVRHNGTNTFYLNGVAYGTSTMTYSNDSRDYLTIGCYAYNNPSTFFNGYIDELRMTREALWTSNFTPPKHPAEPMPLVAAWSFDKDLLTDDSGNNHTLTNVNNVAKVAGKSNYAASFLSASSQYLEITEPFSVSTGNYLMAGWFNFSTLQTSQLLGNQKSKSGYDSNHRGYFLKLENDNGWIIRHSNFYNSNQNTQYSTTQIETDTWYHIVGMRIDGTMHLYVNNNYEGGISSTQDLTTSEPFRIGASNNDNNGISSFLNGKTDEISLMLNNISFNSSTDRDDFVSSLYNNGKGRYFRKKFNVIKNNIPTDGLICYYKFDDVNGVSDLSPYGNDGIANNTSLTTDRNGNENKAFLFNGSNSYINIDTINDDFTPENSSFYIRAKWNNLTTNQYLWGQYFSYGVGCTNATSIYGRSDDSIGDLDTNPYYAVQNNVWYDIVFITVTGETTKLYVNKVLVAESPRNYTVHTPFGGHFNIGCHYQVSGGYQRFFNGAISEFRGYNRALTEKEIVQLYNYN